MIKTNLFFDFVAVAVAVAAAVGPVGGPVAVAAPTTTFLCFPRSRNTNGCTTGGWKSNVKTKRSIP